MIKPYAEKIDAASEQIATLRSLMQRPESVQKELEMGLLQQYLDDESLYIKQTPRVRMRNAKNVGPLQRLQGVCRCSALHSVPA